MASTIQSIAPGRVNYFGLWLRQISPKYLVEVDVSLAPLRGFSFSLLREGWAALLLDESQAVLDVFQDEWKRNPQVKCAHFGPKAFDGQTSAPNSLVSILERNNVPNEFGILILNRAESRSKTLTELEASPFRPLTIAVRDEAEPSNVRYVTYSFLLSRGYRFAGVEREFAIWTKLTDLFVPLHGADSPSLLPLALTKSGRACFDTPTADEQYAIAGRLDLFVGGWAFIDETKVVPPVVLVEKMDLRTGVVEYYPASRYARLDVSQHFGKAELLMSGFECTLPMRNCHPNGFRLKVVQCDSTDCYFSTAQLTITRGLESYEQSSREGLARKFLRGSGIEIGALQRKLLLPSGSQVRYMDRMTVDDLFQHYPELQGLPLQAPDLVDDGERPTNLVRNSLDFVVANHFFEHSENPIQTLKNLLGVLKPTGILFMAVPDKRYTFDALRPSTSFAILRRTFDTGSRPDRLKLYREWVEYVELNTTPEWEERVATLMQQNYSIHFNVWSADELFMFLLQARSEFDIPFEVCSTVCSDNETIVLLERTN